MEFQIGNYRVIIREGKSRSVMELSFHHHPGLTSVFVDAPEELIHPVFRSTFERKIKDVIDTVDRTKLMSKATNYIPARKRQTKWAVRKFKAEFEAIHGNIEDAKDDWDYNKAPRNSVKTGKHGDLKSFLTQRIGRELKL